MPCNSRAVFTAALQVNLNDVLSSDAAIEAMKTTIRQHLKLAVDANVTFNRGPYAAYFTSPGGYTVTLTDGGVQVTGPYSWNGNPLKDAIAAQVKTFGRMGAQKNFVTALRKIGRIESDRLSQSGARVVQATLQI